MIFDFECVDCCHVFEAYVKSDDPNPPCPKCGENTEKKISPTRLKFNEPWRKAGQRFK